MGNGRKRYRPANSGGRNMGRASYSNRKRSRVVFANVTPAMRAYHRARRPKQRKRGTMHLSATAFPKTAVVKHKYVCRGRLAPVSTSATKAVIIRANSLYDPEYATGAFQHQPLLFDQMAAMYDHYTVTSAYITVSIWSEASQITGYMDPLALSLQLKDDATVPTSAYLAREQPNVSYTTLIAPQRKHVLKKSFNASTFFGKKGIVGESELSGGIGSNPTEGAFFILTCTDLGVAHDGESDATYPIQYEITLTQQATWTERKPIQTS